ncbi:hypothetical protein CEXT_313801 [Caerostris extrusa]|uniref:Uncharacterized protein n=1 Tax=Caerostris extrusa TaxID=172846 RepID=A0AAV4QF03_CAEEX|nr:hypothetical protein CEXT_313801 [Caerostris extrusa]
MQSVERKQQQRATKTVAAQKHDLPKTDTLTISYEQQRAEIFAGMFYFGEKLYLSEAAADSLRRVPLNSSDVAPSLRFALTKYRFVAAAGERVLFS